MQLDKSRVEKELGVVHFRTLVTLTLTLTVRRVTKVREWTRAKEFAVGHAQRPSRIP